MSEKVLGFKEKDAIDYGGTTIEVRKDVLCPVVSLEWLEKQKDLIGKTKPLSDKELNAYLQGKLDFYYDLLSAAKKQAGEK